jgi:hypothetical protein
MFSVFFLNHERHYTHTMDIWFCSEGIFRHMCSSGRQQLHNFVYLPVLCGCFGKFPLSEHVVFLSSLRLWVLLSGANKPAKDLA